MQNAYTLAFGGLLLIGARAGDARAAVNELLSLQPLRDSQDNASDIRGTSTIMNASAHTRYAEHAPRIERPAIAMRLSVAQVWSDGRGAGHHILDSGQVPRLNREGWLKASDWLDPRRFGVRRSL